MKKKVLVVFVVLLIQFSFCELAAQDFPRDTSYTLQSAYQKYVKEYPNIELVDQSLENRVQTHNNIVYKNTGQRNLHLDVYQPKQKTGQPLPGVLLVHGGGWISGNKSMIKEMALRLVASGYIAVAVEYRLSPEAEYPAAVFDVKSALKWMKDHSSEYHIDPQKISVLGTSAGGQIAALVAATQNEAMFEDSADTSQASTEVQALIDVDGILAFIHPVSEEGRVASLWLGGTQEEAYKTWIEASALTHVNENAPPALFIGSSYPRFLAGRKEMVTILDENDIYNKTHLLENAPHSFWLFHPWFELTMGYIVDFLKETQK